MVGTQLAATIARIERAAGVYRDKALLDQEVRLILTGRQVVDLAEYLEAAAARPETEDRMLLMELQRMIEARLNSCAEPSVDSLRWHQVCTGCGYPLGSWHLPGCPTDAKGRAVGEIPGTVGLGDCGRR